MNLAPRLDPRRPGGGALPRTRGRRGGLGRRAAALPARPAARARRPSRRGSHAGSGSFVEVRDAEGAERALVSAVRGGASPAQLADMLFAAATDHRYLDGGHTLDFVNKALEALDVAGWERAEAVLASLPAQLAGAERMEEANAWRNPVDLVALLERAFARARGRARRRLRAARRLGRPRARSSRPCSATSRRRALEALLAALREGATEVELASAVTFAAATRIARFPTSNEFGDWDTALHTFTFANAVEQGLRRSPSSELLRGVLDAAMSVHLDRFLNVPATRLPDARSRRRSGRAARRAAARCSIGSSRSTRRRSSSLVPRRRRRAARGSSPRSARRSSARTATSTRSSASRRRCGSTSCCAERRRSATADRGGALPGGARDDDALAAADVRDRATPPPRREALRGRRGLKRAPRATYRASRSSESILARTRNGKV